MFFSQNKASPTGYFWTTIFQISNLNRIFFHHCWAKSENSKITQIYLSWTINDPIFSKIGENKKIFQNSIEKKNMRNFLTKKKSIFFDFFSKRCSFYSSKGTKNNQENLVSNFREICEILVKIRFLTKYTRFVRNFLKKLFLFFFTNFYTTDTLKSHLRGPKIISVIYQVVFEK